MKLENEYWLTLAVLPLCFTLYEQAFAQSNLESGIEENSENQFLDKFGFVHVLGEIQNRLNMKIDFVKVNVAYFDSQNKIIGTDFVYSDPSTLLPSQTATYQALTSPNALASSDVVSVKVNYEYQVNGVTYQSPGKGSRPMTSNMVSESPDLGLNDPDCERVILGNFTLTANIVCKGKDGLIVGDDNTTINLNGYSIQGPGENSNKVGIPVPHANNVVINGPGAISNFQAGILITGSKNTEVNRVTFEGNKIAVFITNGSGTAIEQNFIGPNTLGVASHSSSGLQIHANMMTGNNLAGVTFVNTSSSQVNANSIGGSRNGIFLDAQSALNTIGFNNVLKNDVDINNADGLPLTINGNQLLKNNCAVSQPTGSCNFQLPE